MDRASDVAIITDAGLAALSERKKLGCDGITLCNGEVKFTQGGVVVASIKADIEVKNPAGCQLQLSGFQGELKAHLSRPLQSTSEAA